MSSYRQPGYSIPTVGEIESDEPPLLSRVRDTEAFKCRLRSTPAPILILVSSHSRVVTSRESLPGTVPTSWLGFVSAQCPSRSVRVGE
jgi:hypothetical protein